MPLPIYKNLSEKNPVFDSIEIGDVTSLHDQLVKLADEGFYFRGQANGSWKLYSSAQREWVIKGLSAKFTSVTDFGKKHIAFQLEQAKTQYAGACKQQNDISALSVMQHYGASSLFKTMASLFIELIACEL